LSSSVDDIVNIVSLRLCRRTVRKAYGFPATKSPDSEATPRIRRGAASPEEQRRVGRKGTAFPHCAAAKPRLTPSLDVHYRTNLAGSFAKSPRSQLVLPALNKSILSGERVAIIRPFSALRPQADRAAQVAAVPYDVVNTEEARALASGNRWSFLHVSRPEIDLPDGTPIYSDEVYAKALANFEKLKKECPLESEETPSLYLYRLIMGRHEQMGVVACCSVDEYDQDMIRKHERTRRDKEDDRTRHMMVLRAQTGPVFLTYRAQAKIDALVAYALDGNPPLYDFIANDDIRHTIWRAPNYHPLVEAFSEVPHLYIADGHHRAASASRARAELKETGFSFIGNEEYNFFQCAMFPDNQLQILPYNRIVRDLNGLSKEDFLAGVRERFAVTDNASQSPAARGRWSMYLEGRWYGLALPDDATRPSGVVDSLDVSILQDRLLDPSLGIKDVRTDKRIDFVGGIRGTEELEKLVKEGKAAVAFSLYPTTIEDLLRVSDAGEIMPPKSTWFEPKLRDGLLIHQI